MRCFGSMSFAAAITFASEVLLSSGTDLEQQGSTLSTGVLCFIGEIPGGTLSETDELFPFPFPFPGCGEDVAAVAVVLDLAGGEDGEVDEGGVFGLEDVVDCLFDFGTIGK